MNWTTGSDGILSLSWSLSDRALIGILLRAILALIPAYLLLSEASPFKYAKHTLTPGAPIVGRKWWFEPLFVTRYRFLLNGWSITKEGKEKYHDRPFTIVRPDSNVTVLPQRYVDELQNMHDHKLHPIEALSHDMLGEYTGMTILVGSHLSFNVIRNKLTPKLGSLLPVLAEEVEYALNVEMPSCKDKWVEVDLNTIMTRTISRLTSRTWVGMVLCRNDDWHSANLYTTQQIFYSALTLKCLPKTLHAIVAPILPTRRKLHRGLVRVHNYLVPIINERRRREREAAEGKREPYEKPDDVLQWMMDGAEGEERAPENLATRYVFSVIGSLYTVSAGLVDCLYDLAARPEYLDPLREEIRQAVGEANSEGAGWNKDTLAKLVKMDSFMKESQRVNAPSPISFKRIVKEQLTLSDGLTLPQGAYVCVVNTSSVGREAEPFDGFRYSKTREEQNNPRLQYSSTDRDHITFGHGRFACPGRFVAAAEIKLVLAAFLQRYDLSFGEGRGRPKNLQLLELGFQDPSKLVYVRERQREQQQRQRQ